MVEDKAGERREVAYSGASGLERDSFGAELVFMRGGQEGPVDGFNEKREFLVIGTCEADGRDGDDLWGSRLRVGRERAEDVEQSGGDQVGGSM